MGAPCTALSTSLCNSSLKKPALPLHSTGAGAPPGSKNCRRIWGAAVQCVRFRTFQLRLQGHPTFYLTLKCRHSESIELAPVVLVGSAEEGVPAPTYFVTSVQLLKTSTLADLELRGCEDARPGSAPRPTASEPREPSRSLRLPRLPWIGLPALPGGEEGGPEEAAGHLPRRVSRKKFGVLRWLGILRELPEQIAEPQRGFSGQ